MSLGTIQQSAFHFDRTGEVAPVDAFPTSDEIAAMDLCFEQASLAMQAGNPPIAAVLLDHERSLLWGAQTVDKTTPVLLGHAETRAYDQAKTTVGDDLSNCTLVTTAEPCNTCTAPYAEGNVGRIVYAAPRAAIRALTGIMRDRKINMADLLEDGATETTVIAGYRFEEAAVLFGLYGKLRDWEAQPIDEEVIRASLPLPRDMRTEVTIR